MKPLRGAVIGAGYFSQFHFDAWQRIEGCEIVAVCDTSPDAAATAARTWNVAGQYSDVDELLQQERLDFVDIVTRPDTHLALVQAVATKGLPIICQKALAPTIGEAQQIVAIARRSGVPFMVHENFRFQPWYREIRRQIEAGAIGEKLHSISFRCRTGDGWQPDAYLARQPYFRDMPRLLIFETGVHFVDTYRYLFGEIDGVYASLRRLNGDIAGEDAGVVMFEFQSGASGIWDANRYNEPASADARFTFGEATVEGSGGTIRLYGNGRLTLQPLDQPETDIDYNYSRNGFAGDCVFATQQHFVDQLRAGEDFETSGEQYLKSLQVVEAIYESATDRTPVRGLQGEAS